MYKIDEDEFYSITQLKNKVAFIRKLSELGGSNSPNITSEQVATIFIEIEDVLDEVISKIEMIIQDEPLTVPSE